MTFSAQVKIELAEKKIRKGDCAVASCYAIACFCKTFDARALVLQTELEAVVRYVRKSFAVCGITGIVTTLSRANGALYEFRIEEPSEMEKLCALLELTNQQVSLQINPIFVRTNEMVRAFVASAFLCAGTITDPQKDYNLEFSTARHNLAKDFEALLAQHEFSPHRTCRKGVNVVYLKASGKIEDVLTFMGASVASLAIMEQKMYKSIRNQTNRLTNCETANLSKTVQANALTKKAILYLQANDLFASLPQQLQEAAQLRMDYPNETLARLAEHANPPISKSGLSHRMKKIEAIAAKCQAQEEQARGAMHE